MYLLLKYMCLPRSVFVNKTRSYVPESLSRAWSRVGGGDIGGDTFGDGNTDDGTTDDGTVNSFI